MFLEKPTKIADEERTKLDLEIFGYDPTVAPAGKSVIKVLIKTRYSYWSELHKDQAKYAMEKQKTALTVLQLLEKRYPGITGQVEVTDVATPVTTERYTGIGQQFDFNWGFIGTLSFIRSKPKMLPGLKSFYMVGGAAGLPGCAGQGRNTIKEICKKEDQSFKTTRA